jgi:hypothetical protein
MIVVNVENYSVVDAIRANSIGYENPSKKRGYLSS